MKLKQFFSTFIILGILSLPTLLVLNGGSTAPTFWNYEQYISADKEAGFRDTLGYSTFGDLEELEASIYANKVIAAIGSDYQAAKFVANNVIQKIDFNKLWGLEYNDANELKPLLQAIYTPFVFKALDEAFNLNGQNLWEYVVPYFAQQKVVAFDMNKGTWNSEEQAQLMSPEGVSALFPDKSYQGILNNLKNHGYSRLVINDYLRDNMMIGSEISPGGFSSLPTIDNYQVQINNFKNTIENNDGFGQPIASNNVKFTTDGTTVLQDLIDPSKNWDTAILYNGDALDAYNGRGHFPTLSSDHFVRVVFPQNPIYLIDTLIIPAYINNDSSEKLLDKAYDAIIKNLFENGNVTNLTGIDLENPPNNYPILVNFDFIVYSLPYAIYDEAIKDQYFKNDEDQIDQIALNMYTLTAPLDQISNHFAQKITDALFTSMFYYYMLIKN